MSFCVSIGLIRVLTLRVSGRKDHCVGWNRRNGERMDKRRARVAARGTQERWKRAVAVMLTGVLSFEAAFGNGLSTAFASPLGTDVENLESVQVIQGDELQDLVLTEESTNPDQTDNSQEPELESEPEDVRTEAWDWTGDTTHLMLMADNLVIDYGAVQELLNTTDQDAEKDAEPEEGAEGTDPLDLLPEQLPASVDLSFSLDSAVQGDTSDQEAETTDVPASLIAGDYFTVKLPDGVTLQDTDQPIDIFELDENDEPTTVRIATAEAQDEGTALKVTLTEPEDLAIDQTDQAVDQVESTDQTEQTITSTRSDVELSVSLESSLLAEDDAELIWALQTSSDDEADTQEAKLTLPAAAKLIEQLGIELPMVEEAEEESTTEETTEETSEEQADAASQTDVTYEPVGNASGSASLTMNWYDNNDSGNKRPGTDAVAQGLSLTFSLDGGDPLPLNEENAEKYFDMSEDAIARLFSVKETGVGTYTATASGLYTQVKDSNGITHNVTWTLSSAAEPEGYHRTQGEDGILNFQLLATSTYTIVAKVGEEKLSMGPAPASDFVVIDGTDNEVPLSVVNKQPGWTGTWDAESGTYKLTAPAYGLDGLPIEYGLTYTPETPGPTPGDGYTVTYDNAASANHGSSTTAVYDGGTATILRVGTTTFTATKQWLDAGNKQGKRPKDDDTITFTLWRYSSNGDTAANAAQVTDAAGNFVTLTAKVEDVTKNNAIDLGALLASQYPGLTLEKYDNDGYAYYYGIREESSFANYTTVYGSVADDGQTATDTAPNYTNIPQKNRGRIIALCRPTSYRSNMWTIPQID